MGIVKAYGEDLAYIHDVGYGDVARSAASGLLGTLRHHGIEGGLVVDLGCGSGIWAAALAAAGYEVIGVDQSADMIQIARERAPRAQFAVGSFVDFPMPRCRAVTALGEVFNYLFDERHSADGLAAVLRRVFAALEPGGVLIFDVAEPGRCQGVAQRFTEGDDWTCLVEYQHDPSRQILTRRIVSFRRLSTMYRRSEETHRQQLYDASHVTTLLRETGFSVNVVRSYGRYSLPENTAGFIALKPRA